MHQYSNNDIEQRTGLKPDFINHCNSKLERDETQRPLADQGRKLKELLDEKRASHTREHVRRERRQALHTELAKLHGWGKKKRRQEILVELRHLDAEA